MSFDILCECSEDKLNENEEYYICTMYAFVEDGIGGMNLNTGGGGSNVSEETRAKISAAKKGNKCCEGRKHSEETKKKLSEAAKGHAVSPETRAKIGAVHKGKNCQRRLKKS